MKTNLIDRLRLPVPEDWKKIRMFCFWVGALLTAIAGYLLKQNPDNEILLMLTGIGGAATFISTFLASLTVSDKDVQFLEYVREADISFGLRIYNNAYRSYMLALEIKDDSYCRSMIKKCEDMQTGPNLKL